MSETSSVTNIKSCLKKEDQAAVATAAAGTTLVQKRKKKVWFDEIIVREYPIILGDNPATTDGIPITIDWQPQGKEVRLDIEYFELYRKCRKIGDQLKLDNEIRTLLAIKGGCSLNDIVTTAIDIAQIQRLRVKSSQKNKWELLKEGIFDQTFLFNNVYNNNNNNNENDTVHVHFTKIPSEVPTVLSRWSGKERRQQYLNAAA